MRITEKFFSVQGEGQYTGTPMAFIRLSGCSVGKSVCTHCDTDFNKMLPWQGGGDISVSDLLLWTGHYETVCLTGGEPFDHDLMDLVTVLRDAGKRIHVETSGTVVPQFPLSYLTWITVSPKPGYLDGMIDVASELKVVVGGLGPGPGWPSIEDVLRWHEENPGRPIYLQPRNDKYGINYTEMRHVQDLLHQYPFLRLSVQLHKMLQVR